MYVFTEGKHFVALGAVVVVAILFVVALKVYRYFKPRPVTKYQEVPACELVTPSEPAKKSINDIVFSNELNFTLNGTAIKLVNPDPATLLAYFIRDTASLKGTKLGCEEGGCGACTVVLKREDTSMAINSCLRPLCAVDGCAITTVEAIGSMQSGLSCEQQAIVDNNGTQCGFCTPGWVTNMHAKNEAYDTTQLEKYFDGNICRCTGYRAIMKSFKSCNTCEHASECGIGDMEDIGACKHKHVSAPITTTSTSPQPLHFASSTLQWYRPLTLDQLSIIMNHYQNSRVQLLVGNTSIGVSKYLNESGPYYSADAYDVIIDISRIPELSSSVFDSSSQSLTVGAATSLTSLINQLQSHASSKQCLFTVTAEHLKSIANTQVRNAASWAGNLMLFYRYPTFPSDAVLSLATAEASLTIITASGQVQVVSLDQFIHHQLSSSFVIISMTVTNQDQRNVVMETFKVAMRHKNAHAQVNSGFKFRIAHNVTAPPVCLAARVVVGGASETTFVAYRTQQALHNAPLTSSTLQRALQALSMDLQAVGASTTYGNQAYRESVMKSDLYRIFLRCYGMSQLPHNLQSVLLPHIQPECRGVEVYQHHDKRSPVGVAVPKLESKAQSTGQAVYPSDEVVPPQGLHGAMVFSTQCAVLLQNIDTSSALTLPGVVKILTASDIPGDNAVGSDGLKLLVPVGSEVECVGAPVAIIVATSETAANAAAAQVKVTYASLGKVPIVSLQQAIEQKSFYDIGVQPSINVIRAGDPEAALASSEYQVEGTIFAGGQSHFYMETQTAIASMSDGENVEVTCGTQDPSGYQSYIAGVLNIPLHKVSVRCARSGGGFGGKITRGISVAAAAALASSIVNRPVRIFNSRTADMNMTGGREDFSFKYKMGFNKDGKITAVLMDTYINAGINSADAYGGLFMGMRWADNAYYLPNYLSTATLCYTNTPARTSMRAPGVVQTCFATEALVERVAQELRKPVVEVQQMNFIQNGLTTILGQPISDCTLDIAWDTLMKRSHYQQRLDAIESYNANNLWRKKGISIVPVKYGMGWEYYNAGVQIGVYKGDGTVMVCHNGCEIGQGINTKVAQTVAYELGIDISQVRVTPANTSRVANGGLTGGSGTSEVCCQAAVKACRVLNARLLPFRAQSPGIGWVDLLNVLPPEISLNAEGWFSPSSEADGQPFQYFVYGAAVAEISMDVLSGEVNVLSAEIVYDCGVSLNPAVDIGQIEGGFIMGLGYFLTEKVEYDAKGVLITAGTWEYKPPLVQDIPSVFNVTLLKNLPNRNGILRSKAVGEPPFILSNAVYFATKQAIMSARADAGHREYVSPDAPLNVDLRQQYCLVTEDRFVLPN